MERVNRVGHFRHFTENSANVKQTRSSFPASAHAQQQLVRLSFKYEEFKTCYKVERLLLHLLDVM